MTRLAAVGSTLLCGFAGLYLLGIESAAENTILEAIAHGIGIYFIGKGVFVGALLWHHANELAAIRALRYDEEGG